MLPCIPAAGQHYQQLLLVGIVVASVPIPVPDAPVHVVDRVAFHLDVPDTAVGCSSPYAFFVGVTVVAVEIHQYDPADS